MRVVCLCYVLRMSWACPVLVTYACHLPCACPACLVCLSIALPARNQVIMGVFGDYWAHAGRAAQARPLSPPPAGRNRQSLMVASPPTLRPRGSRVKELLALGLSCIALGVMWLVCMGCVWISHGHHLDHDLCIRSFVRSFVRSFRLFRSSRSWHVSSFVRSFRLFRSFRS